LPFGVWTVVEVRVAGAASVPELQDDAATGRVHGVGRALPAGDLRLAVDARLAPERRLPGHGHRRFRDDQASAGALGVVLGDQRARDMVVFGPAAGERRHEDAIGQLKVACVEGREQGRHRKVPWRKIASVSGNDPRIHA
jgi:hypothetical protein